MWYGWIPTLKNGAPNIIRNRPLRSTERYALHDYSEGDPILRFRYDAEDGADEITVTIVNGFFQMDGLHGMERPRAHAVMNGLYALLKRSYHTDITHSEVANLTVVEAADVRMATSLIADMIVNRCENFLSGMDGIVDVKTLSSLYLNSRGSAEYGLSYLNRYKADLLEPYAGYYERLSSVSCFIESIYETKFNIVQFEMARQSKALSESMRELSRHTESLSVAVLAVTAASVMMTCISFAMDNQDLGALKTAMVISIAVAVPILTLAFSHLKLIRFTDQRAGHPPSE